ncbi:hypothetical protein C1645_812117 [Glomus cerebriforme]|uniref:Uncharacterized protein n=1 Tax=Glomus cerebriforme TaxID=658196 RepID=A0A397TVQ1_9GLOM|nr:hypothetical protein C1645_812117 [Glomus cerebriforme]
MISIVCNKPHNGDTNKVTGKKPHNSKPITMIEISPKGTYLVTYSPEDKSIFVWKVENVKEVNSSHIEKKCVSDDKILAYILTNYVKIMDMHMNNDGQEIKLNLNALDYNRYYCTFNLKGEFILYNIGCDKYNINKTWLQSNPFVKTISGDIYKTWNGEALINFKWNTYRKYYYTIIWISFMALLGCFTAVATIQNIDKDTQKQLLITTIILGIIHLSFEVRHLFMILLNGFMIFGIYLVNIMAYVLLTFTSIYWVFESFGVYFAIIISVAKQVFYFLVVLFIIMLSFAHALYILLLPRSEFSFEQRTNNNDPYNPWNMAPTFSKILDDGTIDFRTSLFAIYYYTNADKTREEIKRLVSKGQWKTNEFSELKQVLLKELNAQDIDEIETN